MKKEKTLVYRIYVNSSNSGIKALKNGEDSFIEFADLAKAEYFLQELLKCSKTGNGYIPSQALRSVGQPMLKRYTIKKVYSTTFEDLGF